MQIPRSQGRTTAQPTLQQHTPISGLSSIGNSIGGAIQGRDEKLQEQEVTAKRLELYHNDLAEKEAKVKLDDVMTTEMSDQVTIVKNNLANGTINANQASENLKKWSDDRYKQLEEDMPLHARKDLQNYWDENRNRQGISFLPLQLSADAKKGVTIAEQAFDISTRQDRDNGRLYLIKNMDGLNLSVADKADRLSKYDTTRDILDIDKRTTNAVEANSIDDLNTLLGEVRGGGYKYLDGPTNQNKEKEILSRIGALQQKNQVEENKRVSLAGKQFNDFKTNVLTGALLETDYRNSIGASVKGTEFEGEFNFFDKLSDKFQQFGRGTTSQMLTQINQQKAQMKNSPSSDPSQEQKILSTFESMYQDKLAKGKENPNQLTREAGLNPHALSAIELKTNSQSFASKVIENGVNQYAMKDANIKVQPISSEDLPEAKKAFDAMPVNDKLNFIGQLISQSKGLSNGNSIWGATLGQLGGGDQSYILAGVARMNNYRTEKGLDVATAIVSGTQALKNKQLLMPKDEILKQKFNEYVGNTVSGQTANMTFSGYKSIYAHLVESDNYQHKDDKDINKSLSNLALNMTTGGVYDQDVKFGGQKWKVSKPYGMKDSNFQSRLTQGYSMISKHTGIADADLQTLRLRRSEHRSSKGEIQYDLINERGNPLIVAGNIWRINMTGATK